jgi:hypothetical protein
MNDTEISFDNEMKSPGMARFVGRALAGTVLQVFDKVEYVEVDSIKHLEKTLNVASNMPEPHEIAEAHKINDLHLAGKDSELPYEGMMLTTKVAEAGRMVRLEHGPEYFPMSFTAISIGKVAFFGIPGEPFNGIGKALKETEGFELIIPSCLVNGSEGYFPLNDAYEQGGYEARSSNFKAGVADLIVSTGLSMLEDIRD